MVSAVGILRETVDDIFSDPRAAIVCLVPMMATLIPGLAFGLMTDVEQGSYAFPAVIFVIVAVLLYMWTAVAWHRRIILHETPRSVLPPLVARAVLGYLGRSIVLLLVSIPIALFPVMFVMAAAVGLASEQDAPTQLSTSLGVYGPIFVVITLVFGALLRLSLILPASAVQHDLSLSEAWSATSGQFFRVFVPLALLLNVLTFVFEQIALLFPLGPLFDLMSAGVLTLVGIGVITRLYIHFVPRGAKPGDASLPAPPGADMPAS